MVRQAKKIIKEKKIGDLEYINVEYVQDWTNGKKVTVKNSKDIFGS